MSHTKVCSRCKLTVTFMTLRANHPMQEEWKWTQDCLFSLRPFFFYINWPSVPVIIYHFWILTHSLTSPHLSFFCRIWSSKFVVNIKLDRIEYEIYIFCYISSTLQWIIIKSDIFIPFHIHCLVETAYEYKFTNISSKNISWFIDKESGNAQMETISNNQRIIIIRSKP